MFIKVKNCHDCPFAYYSPHFGDCCSHPKIKYEHNPIRNFYDTLAGFCPLRECSIVIEAAEKKE